MRALCLVLLLAVTAAARPAHAVCNATGACPNLVAACCGSTSCALDGTITLSGGPCSLDFGTRNVTLSGTLTVPAEPSAAPGAPPNVVEVHAGQFHVTGKLTSNGAPGSSVTITRPAGGKLTAVSIDFNGQIDLSGHGDAGSLTVDADGPISFSGTALRASALDTTGSGGSIDLSTSFASTTQDAITIDVPVTLNGTAAGLGGGFSASAPSGRFTLTSRGSIAARGDDASVSIDLDGKATFAAGSLVDVGGLTTTSGDAGQIEVTAGAIDALGSMSADGGSGTLGNAGGDGGEIDLTALTGALNVTRNVGIGLLVDGALGAMGGTIDVESDSPSGGAIAIGAVLSAQGSGGSNLDSGGGTVIVDAGANLTVSKKVDVSATGGDAGEVDLSTDRGDLNVSAPLNGTSPQNAGTVVLDGSRDVLITGDFLMRGVASTPSAGGAINVNGDRDVTVGANLDVSGSQSQTGGDIDVEAGRDLKVLSSGAIHADGGSSLGVAGTVRLFGGSPSYTGGLSVLGTVTALGQPDGTSRPSIDIEGCATAIGPAATVDSTGAASKSNLIIGRASIAVTGTSKVRSGANTAAYPFGATPTFVAGVSPAVACACPSGPASLACCARPPCTAPGTPIGCLTPCPTCGNGGAPEFPETCDPGASKDVCSGCNFHCRIQSCADANPCIQTSCDQNFGCLRELKPDGSPCPDGNACNGDETCRSGGCASGLPPDCDDGNPCTTDCNPATGCLQVPTPVADGTTPNACQDGNACNGAEACKAGACGPGTPMNCDDQNPATLDSCNTVAGNAVCQHAPPPPCAIDLDCQANNVCNSCDQATHKCRQASDGTSCADADKCNGTETCVSGACVAGTRIDCDDNDLCTADSCDAATGCVHTPVANCCETPAAVSGEAACNDSNACTTDGCSADHQCTHDNIPDCCAIDADCKAGRDPACSSDTCNLGVSPHTCVHTDLHEGQSCNQDVCTIGATCTHGQCDGGQPLPCTQHNDVCILDTCDPVDGCSSTAVDGCCHTDAECNDQNACTTDACQDNRCVYAQPDPTCRPCSKDTDCDAVFGRCAGQACSGGLCIAVDPFSCPPGNVCRLDGTGAPVCRCNSAAACNDGNACNGTESCDTATGSCVAGTAPNCDDGDVCTDDSCDPARGCVNTAPSGFAGVTAQLREVTAAAGRAGSTDLSGALKKGLTGKVSAVQAKVSAASDVAGHSVKREGKLLKAASANLKKVNALIAKGRKGKKPKISQALAATLTARLGCASGALQSLQASLTP